MKTTTTCHPEERSDEGSGIDRSYSRSIGSRSFVAALLRMIVFPSPHLRSSAFIGGLILCGCSGYTGPRSVVNEDPAVKIPEIRKAVDAHDRSVAPQLVKDLDSDDAAVRFYAIGALSRLYGEDKLGYDWTAADRHARAASIEQWNHRIAADAGGKP